MSYLDDILDKKYKLAALKFREYTGLSEDYIIDEACIKQNFLGAFSHVANETGLSEQGVRTALFKSNKKETK